MADLRKPSWGEYLIRCADKQGRVRWIEVWARDRKDAEARLLDHGWTPQTGEDGHPFIFIDEAGPVPAEAWGAVS